MKVNTLKISLFFIITLSIFVIASGLLAYKNAVGLLTAWNQANKMVIYLKVDATAAERDQLTADLKTRPQVARVELVDREKAGKAFQNSLKQFSSGLITDDEMLDLVPETLEVDLVADLGLQERDEAFSRLNNEVRSNPAVEDTSYGAPGLKKFEKLDRFLRSSGLAVCFILILSISYLVSLMVTVYIDDSKSEIEIYSLLGATRWSIYRLFLADIFRFLSGSLCAALLLLFGVFFYLQNKLAGSELSAVVSGSLRFLSWPEVAGLALVLFVFVYVNAFLTVKSAVNRLNQLSSE